MLGSSLNSSRCSNCALHSALPPGGRCSAASSITAHSCGSVRRGQHLPAATPKVNTPLHLLGIAVGKPCDGTGVFVRLQQSRDEVHLVGADHRGGLLHRHVGLEPRGQQVLVALPPPWRVGLPSQIEKLRAIGFVGAVEHQKIDQIALLEAVSTQLHPADLRPGRSNQVRSFLPTDPRRLTTFTQLHTNGDPQHGRLDAASHRQLILRDG